MMIGLKERFFIATATKAKQLDNIKSSKKTLKTKKSLKTTLENKRTKSASGLEKLSIKNQRRILRLRKKKQSSKDIIGLLHKEMLEHKLSQEQMMASIEFLKHQEKLIKKKSLKLMHKQRVLSELKAKLNLLNDLLESDKSSSESKELSSRIRDLKKLIEKKEMELESLLLIE